MRYLFIGTLIPCLIIFLIGCGAQVEPVKQDDKYVLPKIPLVTTVTFHRYSISDTEHLIIMDIPDKFVPRRCAVFVNETTKTSNSIGCDFDSVGQPMPEQGTE